MEREIIFRGKRVDNGEWVYGDLIYKIEHHIKSEIPSMHYDDKKEQFGQFVDVIPKSVGQYTGLKDRNGIRIFEGDWIQVCAGYVSKIIWSNTDACFISKYSHPEDPEYLLLCDINVGKCEVVGNIHELK